MAEAVAIVSVVVSGLVTPGIVAAYALTQQRQQQFETRRDELRDAIDFAAKQAGAAYRRIEDLEQAWEEGAALGTEELKAKIAASTRRREGTRWAWDRLRIRVGDTDPSALVAAYAAWAEALGRYSGVIEGIEERKSYEAHVAEIEAAKADARMARNTFMKASFEAVGLKPDSRDLSALYP
jgi:hypothetical protein